MIESLNLENVPPPCHNLTVKRCIHSIKLEFAKVHFSKLIPSFTALHPLHLPIERPFRHSGCFGCFAECHFFVPPGLADFVEVFREGSGRTAETDASGFSGGDALSLALADVLALGLGYEGQDLKHQVGDEGAHEVCVTAGVQKRHVDDANVYTQCFRKHAPLLLNLFLVAPQSVDAEDVEEVTPLQLSEHFLICRSVEILS